MILRPLTCLMSLAILAATFAGTPNTATASEYRIDPAHSFIQFRTKHVGISWLIGRFNRFEGQMTYDPDAGQAYQSIEITIDAASLDTNHSERDRHLRSPQFFNVDEHPEVTFVSTGYEGDKSGGVLSGDLTLLDVTRNVSFNVSKIAEGNDPWGGYRAGFEGEYVVTPAEFGMNYRLGPGAETVEVQLFIEAIRQ
ncbi:MAG: YceI family protein [Albidovulum sp.]|nr:YceI family protein [Albidovulum sp.]